MTPSLSRSDAAFVVLAGLTGVADSFAVAGYTRRFVVAPLDALVVRLTPAAVVSWMIVNVGESAHLPHIAQSMVVAVGSLAGSGLVGPRLAGQLDRAVVAAGVVGVFAWGFTTAVTAEPVLTLGAAVPVALVSAIGATPHTRDDRKAAEAVLSWIHTTYDLDDTPETNQNYRVALRICSSSGMVFGVQTCDCSIFSRRRRMP